MAGVFLHTGWRTAGTWVFSRLRADPANYCYYEPLYELLPAIVEAAIIESGTWSWPSRHPLMPDPYFFEFLPLLKPEGGVRLVRPDFGFDRFFADANAKCAELRDYVALLCGTARERGLLPVIKFTRSLGRVPWFVRNFPDVTHVVVTRNPWAQFRSAWICLTVDANPYFLATPFVVLERNAGDSAVAAMIEALELPIAGGVFGTPLERIAYWEDQARTLPMTTLYRTGLALWILSLRTALPEAQLLLDGDRSAGRLAAKFSAATGVAITVDKQRRPETEEMTFRAQNGKLSAEDVHRAHSLAKVSHVADAKTAAMLRRWLADAERGAAEDCSRTEEGRKEALLF